MSYADHDHRGEYADERHDHGGDYAEKHHRHYDDESAVSGLREDLGRAEERIAGLAERLTAAVGRIAQLEDGLRDALNRIHVLEDRQPGLCPCETGVTDWCETHDLMRRPADPEAEEDR